MKRYTAKVIHNIDIVLPDNSSLDKKEWLEIIASNIAHFGHGENGKLVSKEIEIKPKEE